MRFPGASLARYWEPGASGVDTVLVEPTSASDAPRTAKIAAGDMKSVMLGRLHYILNGDGSEEVYDVVANPLERTDVLRTVASDTLEYFRAVTARIPKRSRNARQAF